VRLSSIRYRNQQPVWNWQMRGLYYWLDFVLPPDRFLYTSLYP
jgi:hypothetical protein